MARTPSTEPRTFLGHPLTPQPQPLDRRGREEATQRIEANDAAVANPALLDHLVESNRLLREFAHTVRPARKRILWSGLAQLDNTGVWSDRAGGGLASSAIWVFSPNVPVIVAAGTRQAFPPNSGPGVFMVPAGIELTLNAHTTQWTIYGNGTAGGLTVAGAAPAPGASPAPYVVPAEMSLESVTVTLIPSATAGNRYVILTIRDPSGNLITASDSGALPASETGTFVFSSGPVPSLSGTTLGYYAGSLPPNLTLQAGSTVTITSYGLLAGDQYGAMVVSGAGESLGPSSSSAGALVNVTVYSDYQENR